MMNNNKDDKYYDQYVAMLEEKLKQAKEDKRMQEQVLATLWGD